MEVTRIDNESDARTANVKYLSYKVEQEGKAIPDGWKRCGASSGLIRLSPNFYILPFKTPLGSKYDRLLRDS